jgi:hypothetical protein
MTCAGFAMLILRHRLSGWWFGTFFFFHILGTIVPTAYFSEGLKPPTSYIVNIS